jgi:hypothetical protein
LLLELLDSLPGNSATPPRPSNRHRPHEDPLCDTDLEPADSLSAIMVFPDGGGEESSSSSADEGERDDEEDDGEEEGAASAPAAAAAAAAAQEEKEAEQKAKDRLSTSGKGISSPPAEKPAFSETRRQQGGGTAAHMASLLEFTLKDNELRVQPPSDRTPGYNSPTKPSTISISTGLPPRDRDSTVVIQRRRSFVGPIYGASPNDAAAPTHEKLWASGRVPPPPARGHNAVTIMQAALRTPAVYDSVYAECLAQDPHLTGLVNRVLFRRILTQHAGAMTNLAYEKLCHFVNCRRDAEIVYAEVAGPPPPPQQKK